MEQEAAQIAYKDFVASFEPETSDLYSDRDLPAALKPKAFVKASSKINDNDVHPIAKNKISLEADLETDLKIFNNDSTELSWRRKRQMDALLEELKKFL